MAVLIFAQDNKAASDQMGDRNSINVGTVINQTVYLNNVAVNAHNFNAEFDQSIVTVNHQEKVIMLI